MNAFRTKILVQVEDGLAIALAVEAMSRGNQFGSQFHKIVYLAIRYQNQAPVFIKQWLGTAGEIYDTKAPHGETHMDTLKPAPTVGSPMHHRLLHPVNRSGRLFIQRRT